MKDINYFSSYIDIVASLAKNMSGKEDSLDNLILQQALVNGLLTSIQDTKKDIDIQVESTMQGTTPN
jgi:hypothetical protein